jgi:hypothetical protein
VIPTSNLAHLLIQTARRFPDRPAIIWRDTTWTDFFARLQFDASQTAFRHLLPTLCHTRLLGHRIEPCAALGMEIQGRFATKK